MHPCFPETFVELPALIGAETIPKRASLICIWAHHSAASILPAMQTLGVEARHRGAERPRHLFSHEVKPWLDQ